MSTIFISSYHHSYYLKKKSKTIVPIFKLTEVLEIQQTMKCKQTENNPRVPNPGSVQIVKWKHNGFIFRKLHIKFSAFSYYECRQKTTVAVKQYIQLSHLQTVFHYTKHNKFVGV